MSSALSVCSSKTLTDSILQQFNDSKYAILPSAHVPIAFPTATETSTAKRAPLIDLDEGVHAFTALVKVIMHAIAGGESLASIEAALLAHSASSYAAFQVALSSIGDFALTMVLSPLTIVLGGLAAKCGWEELEEVSEKTPELNEKLKSFKKQLNDEPLQIEEKRELLALAQKCPALQPKSSRLAQVPESSFIEEKVSLLEYVRAQQGLNATLSDIKTNQLNKGIGEASLGSGTIIAFKALMEWATQLELIISSSTFDVAHLISEGLLTGGQATLATTVGMTSTLVLTPLAAIYAVTLGSYFVEKSVLLKDARQAGRKQFDDLLETDFIKANKEFVKILDDKENLVEKYLSWFDETLKKGEEFDSYFLNCNIAFLASSVVYTLGVIGKAALVIAALAGFTALAANPVLHGIALTLTIIGSIVMTVFSHQFLFGHEQQKNYDSYRTANAPDLDRDFLAAIDGTLGAEEGLKEGVQLRAELLEYYQIRDKAQQEFLDKSPSIKKGFSLPFFATDKSPEENSLKNWLATPEGNKALVEFMGKTLKAQQAYLQAKNTVHQKMYRPGDNFNREKDSALEKQVTSLLDTLEQSLPTGLLGLQKLVEIKKCFIDCQHAQAIDTKINWSDNALLSEVTEEETNGAEEKQNINQLLAQHLLDESYKASFDKLLETEFQARRLYEVMEGTQSASVATKHELLRKPTQSSSANQPVFTEDLMTFPELSRAQRKIPAENVAINQKSLREPTRNSFASQSICGRDSMMWSKFYA